MRQMTALVKPASSLCNLKCSYCFYCDEAENRTGSNSMIMSNATAENLVRKVLDFCGPGSHINFMFQGGEPLLAGIAFYHFFIQKVNQLKDSQTIVSYSLQTNGTLIDEAFCTLFKRHHFLIGVSIDGEEAVHNRNRCGSFSKTMEGISLLKKTGVDFNILSVITAATDASGLFSFYRKNDFRNVQPIYCLDPLSGEKSDFSLDAHALSRFQKQLFDLWLSENRSGKPFYIRDFENLLSLLHNGRAEQCGANGRCTPQLVVEADGTCYPCDFYCLDSYACANINSASIMDVLRSDGLRKFMEFTEPQNQLCTSCPVMPLCGGGCKRYRALYNQLSGYCPRKDFLLYALQRLRNGR